MRRRPRPGSPLDWAGPLIYTRHASRRIAHPFGHSRADHNTVCEFCGRRGRFNIGKLTEQHGADAKLTDLLAVLVGNCPIAGATSINERCKAVYDGLSVTG